MKTRRWILVAALLAAGCTSTGALREEDRLALYETHAGAPVDSLHFVGRLDAWTPLGDRNVALWTRPSQAYLVGFVGSCPDIAFANALAVSSQFNKVYARFDTVTPLGGGVQAMPCRIAQIRPLDTAAIREDERALRHGANLSERPAGAPAP